MSDWVADAASRGYPGGPASGGGEGMGWLGPAIGGLTGLGGAALGSKGANRAAEAQAKAAADALAFQKDQAAKKWAFDQQRWAAWNAGREELMRRYGIDIPASGPPAASEGPGSPARGFDLGGMAAGAIGLSPRLGGQPGVPANLQALLAAGKAGLPQEGAPPAEGGPPEFGDWRRYGLPSA